MDDIEAAARAAWMEARKKEYGMWNSNRKRTATRSFDRWWDLNREQFTSDVMDVDRSESEYPERQLLELCRSDHEHYLDYAEEYDGIGNWQDYQPRVHVFEAVDKMMAARASVPSGNTSRTMMHLADALNHMVFILGVIDEQD